jgi:hypothetical protein
MADDDSNPSRARGFVAMILIVLLIVGGWLLAQRLAQTGRMEDCLMAGRRNCAPITAPSR